jgi:hypothetical protein
MTVSMDAETRRASTPSSSATGSPVSAVPVGSAVSAGLNGKPFPTPRRGRVALACQRCKRRKQKVWLPAFSFVSAVHQGHLASPFIYLFIYLLIYLFIYLFGYRGCVG